MGTQPWRRETGGDRWRLNPGHFFFAGCQTSLALTGDGDLDPCSSFGQMEFLCGFFGGTSVLWTVCIEKLCNLFFFFGGVGGVFSPQLHILL